MKNAKTLLTLKTVILSVFVMSSAAQAEMNGCKLLKRTKSTGEVSFQVSAAGKSFEFETISLAQEAADACADRVMSLTCVERKSEQTHRYGEYGSGGQYSQLVEFNFSVLDQNASRYIKSTVDKSSCEKAILIEGARAARKVWYKDASVSERLSDLFYSY